MRQTASLLITAAFLAPIIATECTALLRAQAPPPQLAPRAGVDLVTMDAVPRDVRTQAFITDLKPGEFEIYEDGVRQTVESAELFHAAGVSTLLALPGMTGSDISVKPAPRRATDVDGRVFLVFIDDLHMGFRQTPRLRTLLKNILTNLIHDGDVFAVVSTGTSSISQPLTDDRQLLEQISNKVIGGGLTPSDIFAANAVTSGREVRHRARVAFETAYDVMNTLQKIPSRRKAVVYVSSGYDFSPVDAARLDLQAELGQALTTDSDRDPFLVPEGRTWAPSESDLIREQAELIRAANRANATFYPVDPSRLAGGQDVVDPVNGQAWTEHLRQTADSLRLLAENTGGFAIMSQNDLAEGLRRIGTEAGEYYMLGYYSSNPTASPRTRQIDIRVTRADVTVKHRPAYTFPQR